MSWSSIMAIIELSDLFKKHFNAWLRIEPRCRQDEFMQGVQARIADPLWMLARQWQTGEFTGEDAGSPIQTEMYYSTQSIDTYQLNDQSGQKMPDNTPLETLVEQEMDSLDYRSRVRIGQEFERRVQALLSDAHSQEDITNLILALRTSQGFAADITPEIENTLDRATRRYVNFMRHRVVDGLAVLQAPLVVPAEMTIAQTYLDEAHNQTLAWHNKVCHRPASTQSPAWQAEQLHYNFKVNAQITNTTGDTLAQKTELVANEYRNGSLDWYSFKSTTDQTRGTWETPKDEQLNPVKTTPTRIEVAGNSPRWWAFEDGQVNFGAMDVAKPDLSKLLLMEFALIYGDDWFSVPAPVDVGSLVKVDQLTVRNVFGDVTNVYPARCVYQGIKNWETYRNPAKRLTSFEMIRTIKDIAVRQSIDPQRIRRFRPNVLHNFAEIVTISKSKRRPQMRKQNARFDLFTISGTFADSPCLDTFSDRVNGSSTVQDQNEPPRPILFIPPVSGYRQESPVLEEVRFLRDENANMVWGIEQTVTNGLGQPVSGFEAQQERTERQREREQNELEALLKQIQEQLEDETIAEQEQQSLQNLSRLAQARLNDLNKDAPAKSTQNSVLQYRLATSVPENWIPFLPMKDGLEDASTPMALADINFRRAQLLRNTEHAMVNMEGIIKPQPITSMTRFLALDDVDNLLLILNEETIPRAGLRVQLTKQRTRYIDGSTHVWVGKKVLIGRGEGNSGLRFDVLRQSDVGE